LQAETTIKMTVSAVERMRNFQIFLFCSADILSLFMNGTIFVLLARNKRARAAPSNSFFVSVIFFQFVTAVCGINFAVRFVENNAEDLRKDTVIVQITFTLIGLGLHHFMLAIDRIVFLNNQKSYSKIMEGRLTWIMIAISWLIPAMIAITSSLFATDGDPSSQVSYALAIITIASGLTLMATLLCLMVFIFKEMKMKENQPIESTRRRRRTIVNDKITSALLPCRTSIVMALVYVVLLFPQVLFAFGKLLKTRGLLDMWYMQLASTIMLCTGISDASLYIYMNSKLREEFKRTIRRLRRKNREEDELKDVKVKEINGVEEVKMDTLLLKSNQKKADIELAYL